MTEQAWHVIQVIMLAVIILLLIFPTWRAR